MIKTIFLILLIQLTYRIGFAQSTSVSYAQQTANYNTTFSSGGGSYNPNANQIGTYANSSGTKQFVAWRPFTTDGSITSAKRRALQVGDQFSIAGTFAQAYGEIGISLLSSPSSELTWADRINNYAVQINLDGPGLTSGGYGNWYIKGTSTTTATFGGVQGTGHNTGQHNFTFTFTLTASDRMNISITDNTNSTVFNAYDVQLNNTNITDYAIYHNDDWDGAYNQDAFWGWASGPNTSIQSTGSISIGSGNTSFSESNIISDGLYADQTSTSYANTLTKNGNGTLTLTAANTLSGAITVSSGTLQLNHIGGGTLPATSNATISHGATLQVSSNQTLNNLILSGIGTLIVDNGVTLTVNGRFSQNGGTVTLNGTGSIVYGTGATLYYGGSTSQLTGGELTATVPNLTINNFAGVTLTSAVGVTGLITLNSGSLSTGGNLTLISSAAGSASIGSVDGFLNTGSILGNVKVQRYIGNNAQWRMIGFPFTAATTISESTLAGFYTGVYKAYTYNEAADDGSNYGSSGAANAGWVQFTAGTINANQGLLLIGGSPSSTINFTGPINQGTQNITLSNSKNGWNLIANPFASNLNWSSIAALNTNVSGTVYRYDPNTTAYGSYNANTSTQAGNQGNVIENGAAFFVQSTGATSLSITENTKTTGSVTASMMGMPTQSDAKSIIKLYLCKQGDQYADEVVIRWGGGYAATDYFDPQFDGYDMGRAAGPDLSVIGNDATVYSIFHGSELKTSSVENRTVQLGIRNITEGTYQLGIQLLSPVANGNKAYLYDSYTNTATLIDGNTNTYSFITTADPKSQSSTRFSVVMNYKEAVNTINTNLPVMLLNNPTTNSVFTLYSKNNYNQLQWQIVDGSGRALQIGAFNSVQKGSTYQINAGTIANGNYFIKLTGDGNALPVLKAIKN